MFSQLLLPVEPIQRRNQGKSAGIEQSERQRKKIATVAMTPPHCLCCVHLNYYVFRSLQNSFNMKEFNFLEACKKHLSHLITQKGVVFWEDGILKMSQR